MRDYRLLLCLAGALLLAAPAHALDTLQAGQWQVTGKRERSGVVTERPPVTRCLTAEQARDIPKRPTEASQGATCRPADYQERGKTASWRMHCSGAFTVDTTASYSVPDPQHYSATFATTVTLGGKTSSSTLTMQGTRLGECPK